jgi:hypothetical protein
MGPIESTCAQHRAPLKRDAARRLHPEASDAERNGEDEAIAYDAARTAWLEARGFHVLRIWNHEFFENPDAVLEYIWRTVTQRAVISPSP